MSVDISPEAVARTIDMVARPQEVRRLVAMISALRSALTCRELEHEGCQKDLREARAEVERLAGRILALERYMIAECLCPCCEQTDVCFDACTFAADCPDDAEAMEYARSVMTGGA